MDDIKLSSPPPPLHPPKKKEQGEENFYSEITTLQIQWYFLWNIQYLKDSGRKR